MLVVVKKHMHEKQQYNKQEVKNLSSIHSCSLSVQEDSHGEASRMR